VRDYEVDFKHDGKLHKIVLPEVEIATCQNCGTVQTDIEIGDKVTKALREQIGLLFPEEIKRQRGALHLSQEQLGECIGAAKESICRWETGALIQSVSTDKLLRMFFKHPTDPVWKNRWSAKEATASGSDQSAESLAIKRFAMPADESTYRLTESFRGLLGSIEWALLSSLMLEEAKLPEVEARLSEEDFQHTALRRAYASMRSVYHDTGKIHPQRMTELLASQVGELPMEPSELVFLLLDTALPQTRIDALIELMSRRSQIHRDWHGTAHDI
jgi:putative zinc finger/helix-turn-helix YgiT family protein